MTGTGFSRLQTMQKYEARDVKSFQMNGQIFLQTKLVIEGNPTFLRGMEMKFVFSPVTFYFWSHCLASICDVRSNLPGFSRYLWKVNCVSGYWIKVREVSRISTQWAHGITAFVQGGHTCLVIQVQLNMLPMKLL